MQVEDLKLAAHLKEKLTQAGLTHTGAILAAGMEGLEAIDGIGPKTATEILQAARLAHEPPSTDEPDASQDQVAHAVASMPDPHAIVTVRNVSAEMILVGERYLLPTQTRSVPRRLLRHIPAGKLVEI